MMIGLKHRVAWVLWLAFLAVQPAAWPQETAPDNSDPLDFLIEAMWHPESRIRQNAVKRLSEMDPKPFDAMTRLVATGDEFQAASAAIVLTNLKTKDQPIPADTLAALYEILNNSDTKVWRWNITATLLAGGPGQRGPITAYSEDEVVPRRQTGIAEESLKDNVDLWIRGVNHRDPMIQLSSLRALQKTGEHGKRAQADVLALLHRHRAPFTSIVLKPALVTYGFTGYEQAIPQYDPVVILETLVAIKADAGLLVEPLTRLTRHTSEYVQLDAAAMLGKIGAAEATTDYASKVLSDLAMLPWGKVRENAVAELGNIGPPAASAIPTLVKLLEGSNGDLRTQAAISLGKMGPTAKPALEALRKAQRYAELDTQEAVDAIKAAIEAIEMPVMEKEKMI